MSDWWSSARQPPDAIPFRNKFDAARDPLTARNAIGAVDARYVADAIAAAGGGGGGGNVSNSGTPTVGQYAKWVTATTIQGVAPATVLSDIGAQPAGSYQPLDADLTSLAAASGTNTIYYRSAADTWSPVVVSTGLAFSGGNLTATGGGGTPGGANTQVQFNDSSAFGGDADLTWNKTTNLLTVNGNILITGGVGNSLQANSVIQGSGFKCAGTVAIFSSELTAGVVNLRPNGFASTTGQFQVTTIGVTATTPITLPANPTANLHAATKQYVDLFAPLASPTFTGTPTAPTPTAGDNDTSIATTAFVTAAVAAGSGGGTIISIGAGRLTYVSATALKFAPFNGNQIKIAGAFYTIPNAGIAGVANTSIFVNGTGGSNLAASTTYWVFAFNNGGTVTADFRTAATHATSSTAGNEGVEILTGNDTRTLIGLVRTNASSQFVDAANQRFVRSWFNDPSVGTKASLTATRTTSAAPFVEIHTEIRNEFLLWSEELADFSVSGAVAASTAGNWCATVITFDGVTGAVGEGTYAVSDTGGGGYARNASFRILRTGLSEGYHYATVGAGTSGGTTGSWIGTPATYAMTLSGRLG